MIGVAVLMVAALAGCDSLAPAAQPAATAPTATVAVDDGFAAPEALRSFTCEADDEGGWSAGGTIENEATSARTFRVRVQVGPAAADVKAREVVLKQIPAGASAPFELPSVPSSADEGPCHIQVAVLN